MVPLAFLILNSVAWLCIGSLSFDFINTWVVLRERSTSTHYLYALSSIRGADFWFTNLCTPSAPSLSSTAHYSLSVDSRGRMHAKGCYEFNIAFLDCRKSSRINTTLAVTGLTPLLIARLDHQDAIARLNLLKLIKVRVISLPSVYFWCILQYYYIIMCSVVVDRSWIDFNLLSLDFSFYYDGVSLFFWFCYLVVEWKF